MCGIAGAHRDWLSERGLDPAAAMRAALDELAWRGPDGSAVEAAGPWWLGCARLAISGPGRQPVALRNGRHVGIMNGALFDARRLWAELRPGIERRRRLPNDAWLPLLALAEARTDLLAGLRGHHAFAVVDRQTGGIVLGQDLYGEKPLHCLLTRRPGEPFRLAAFASTVAALRRLGMPAITDARRTAEWFRFGWSFDRPHRFSAHLRLASPPVRGRPLLPPTPENGKAQWADAITGGEVAWRANGSRSTPRPAPSEPAEGDLRALLTTSVADSLDSPSPAGLSLSGGVDSSCLGLALGALGRRIPAYQFRAAESPPAERDAARAVAARAGLPLREIDAGPEVLDSLPHLTRLAGVPLGDPSILAVHAVARAASNDGVRILLGGEGADELLLGYRRYRALRRMPHLGRLLPFAPRWSMHPAARYWRALRARNPIRALLAVTPPAFGQEVLAPELGDRACWHDAQPLAAGGNRDLALAARDDDLDHYLPRDLLPKVDIALLAAGVEGRCPFLSAGIEGLATTGRDLGKRALIEAFADDLPEAVRRLPKRGFSLPLDRWFRTELPWLDVLAEARSRARPHLRPGGLARAIDLHRRGAADLGHGLYLLLAYELHLRAIEAS